MNVINLQLFAWRSAIRPEAANDLPGGTKNLEVLADDLPSGVKEFKLFVSLNDGIPTLSPSSACSSSYGIIAGLSKILLELKN